MKFQSLHVVGWLVNKNGTKRILLYVWLIFFFFANSKPTLLKCTLNKTFFNIVKGVRS